MSEPPKPLAEPGAGPPEPPAPPAPPPSAPPAWWPGQQPRRPLWKRLLVRLAVVVLVLSVLLNLYLLVLLSVSFFGRGGLETVELEPGRADQVIAVLNISGMIDRKKVAFIGAFRRVVKKDPNVKAVVVRVTSGGGGVASSDQIYQHLKDIKASGKKLVVSMGGVAASGGYYISAPADTIYAEPTTVTGSIGVLAAWPVWKGTLEKIGMKMMIVPASKTKAWKAVPNVFEDPADYQLADVQKTIDRLQERFEQVVSEHRGGKLKLETAQKTYKDANGKEFTVAETEPFNGRVFLGERAKQLGLVDKVGYLNDAIAEARRLAGLTKPKVVLYKKASSLLEQILRARSAPQINLEILEQVQSPRLMMVWRVPQ